MVGDVGTAYLNAKMPTDDPSKRIHMMIDPVVAKIIVAQDPSFSTLLTSNGGLLVALDKALYGCIESARLWNDEISSMLGSVARTRTFPPYQHLIEPIRPIGSATTLLWLRPPVRTSRSAG